VSSGNHKHINESTGAKDMVKRDRFELLSAYLDGELTACERKQVEQWLSDDKSVQLLYARLLKLRQSLRNLPVPQSQSTEETIRQVFTRLRRRSRFIWIGGGTAIAACVIGAVSGLFSGTEPGTLRLAEQPTQQTQSTTSPVVSASPLMIAINDPIIPIPKVAESRSDQLPVQPQRRDSRDNIN
jgi:anti-sigma factor RsiW